MYPQPPLPGAAPRSWNGGEPSRCDEARTFEASRAERRAWTRRRYSAWVHGRSAWLYGDTALNQEGADGSTWRNNTASWTQDRDAFDGLQGFDEWSDAAETPVEFPPRTDAERALAELHERDAMIDAGVPLSTEGPSDRIPPRSAALA